MPFNYSAQRLRADRMITRYGSSTAKLRRAGIDRDCTVVEIAFSPSEKRRLTNPTDRRVLVSALTPAGDILEPPDQQLDKLVMKNPHTGVLQELKIIEPCGRLAPSPLVVFWDLMVRG